MNQMRYSFTFSVTGRGYFPLDMLRHDQCFPATERDSATIDDSSSVPRTIELCTRSQGHGIGKGEFCSGCNSWWFHSSRSGVPRVYDVGGRWDPMARDWL